ncbi:transcriptional regulator [hydrocarbon metagenome]|uniref:Transcriptional regulator n=1 Tax=hydrocarbon metagenome TaxID=938273 RepID=A0A0W8E5J0_9ZZZZ
MKSLEQMLSPMIKNRGIIVPTLDQSDIMLMEKIQQQKIDLVYQRISPSQADLVRPEVVESWMRSYNYGLDLFDYNYGPILDKSELTELLREKDLLIKAADPYLRQLETMLSKSECIILFSDEQGAMLRVIEGNELLKKQNQRFRLVPGSIWTEETVGTCAHGISLIVGTPMQICGPEHYCGTYEQISCSSAPIYDGNGNIAGTLCIVSPSFHQQSYHSLGLVVSMAWAVQNEYQLALNNELLSVTLESAEEAVITINKTGLITKANLTAKKIMHYVERDLVGMQIEEVLGKQPLIKEVLKTGKPILDAEIEMEQWNQRLHLRSAQAVKDQYGQNFGCVLILKKIDRFKKSGSNKISGADAKFTFDRIIGNCPRLIESKNLAIKFAPLEANILIQGESGTGKEVYAQAIHNESRPEGPFIAVNCAAIPRTLIESELFGYEGGAFTGAERQGRPGKIEMADGGTLFLDEIGDMPLEIQPVLLRVLEEKKLMRIGGSRYIPVDFRLVTATNKDLLDLINEKKFREDLYYRLKVLKIFIPPLRERGADIIRLAKYFIHSTVQKQGITVPVLDDGTIFRLFKYGWPGNIRELENAMLYAVNTSKDGVIKPEDLPDEISGIIPWHGHQIGKNDYASEHSVLENRLSIKEMEKITIMQTLLQTGLNVSEAAGILGMSRSTLYRKIKEFHLLDEVRSKESAVD